MAALEVPHFAPLDVAGRLDRLRSKFEEAGIDALVVTNLTNVRYLTGFSGSAAVLAVGVDRAVMVTDGRYRTQAAEQLSAAGMSASIDLVIGGLEEQRAALGSVLEGVERVGLESDNVTWAQATGWKDRLGVL